MSANAAKKTTDLMAGHVPTATARRPAATRPPLAPSLAMPLSAITPHPAADPMRRLAPLRVLAGPPPDLSAGQGPVFTGLILLLHVLVVWALLQLDTVQDAVRKATPVFVQLMLPAAPPEPPKPPLPLPMPAPPSLKPPPAALVSVTAPSPVAAVLVAPTLAAEAMPAPPAPVQAILPTLVAVAPVAPVPPPPAAPAPAPRVLPSSAVQYLVAPVLVYPRLSQRNGETGRIVVRVLIGAAGGAPISVQVSQSSGHARLDDAAIAAVQKARFKPPTDMGQSVEGWALIPIDFDLEK